MNRRKVIDFILVIVVFSLAGLTTMYVSDFILSAFEIRRWSAAYFLLFPVVLMPAHNILLLFYSSFFGEVQLLLGKGKEIFQIYTKIKKQDLPVCNSYTGSGSLFNSFLNCRINVEYFI
jgi:hypothetical protein